MQNNNSNFTNNETSNKRGRGRPHGSNCFTNIPIKTLLEFLDPSFSIPVSKLWLKNTLGLIVEESEVKVLTNNGTRAVEKQEEEEQNAETVQFAVHSFEE